MVNIITGVEYTLNNGTVVRPPLEQAIEQVNANAAAVAEENTFAAKQTFSKGFSLGALTVYTIAAGVITITAPGRLAIDTEGGAATDDLDTINGGSDGDVIIAGSASAARDVTFKDGTGNMRLAGDFSATHFQDQITLMYYGAIAAWVELCRSDNA